MLPTYQKLTAVTWQALKAVKKRRGLQLVNGVTDEMIAEAIAIDEAWGTRPSPEKLREMEAVAKSGIAQLDLFCELYQLCVFVD
jgi:hypothetical protein